VRAAASQWRRGCGAIVQPAEISVVPDSFGDDVKWGNPAPERADTIGEYLRAVVVKSAEPDPVDLDVGSPGRDR
jgi:hypothetical protein